jgi:hypothetical protein
MIFFSIMSIKKIKYKNKAECQVVFHLDDSRALTSKTAMLIGSWDSLGCTKHQMTKLKDGTFVYSLGLQIGKKYEFGYKIDNEVWIHDENADGTVATNINSLNSVLELWF